MNSPDRCRCWTEEAVPERRKGRERKVDTLRITWLYSQGLSRARIAELVGCHKNTVAAVLWELGVSG